MSSINNYVTKRRLFSKQDKAYAVNEFIERRESIAFMSLKYSPAFRNWLKDGDVLQLVSLERGDPTDEIRTTIGEIKDENARRGREDCLKGAQAFFYRGIKRIYVPPYRKI